MTDALKELTDANFRRELEDVEIALVFFSGRRMFGFHDSTNRRLAELIRSRGQFFLADMDANLELGREYGVSVYNSYYLLRRGRLLDSYLSRGSNDLVDIAVWCDAVLDERPRKGRYMEHITSKVASDMIAYLEEMEEEETANTRRVRESLLELDKRLNGTEEQVHAHLWANAFLLDLFYDGGYVLSKFPVGIKHVSDFVVFGYRNWTNDVGIHATLIELERPTAKLFTKAGDPAAVLNHALRQVQDWKAWLGRNGDYFRRTVRSLLAEGNDAGRTIKSTRSLSGFYRDVIVGALDDHVSYAFTIIAGRRPQMTLAERIRLDEMNNSLNGVRIMTYDALLEGWMRRVGSVA